MSCDTSAFARTPPGPKSIGSAGDIIPDEDEAMDLVHAQARLISQLLLPDYRCCSFGCRLGVQHARKEDCLISRSTVNVEDVPQIFVFAI